MLKIYASISKRFQRKEFNKEIQWAVSNADVFY